MKFFAVLGILVVLAAVVISGLTYGGIVRSKGGAGQAICSISPPWLYPEGYCG